MKKHWYKVRIPTVVSLTQSLVQAGHALRRVRRGRGKKYGLASHVADELWQSIALREAIREYEANKWKVIGQKVGKPAKVRLLS